MSKAYEYLEEIYKKNEGIDFNLACQWIMENGYLNVRKWTDEIIEEAKVPNLFADDYYKETLRLAREIANNTSPADLMKFCMIKPFLRLDDFCDKLNREELEAMVIASIQDDLNGGTSIMTTPRDFESEADRDYFQDKYDCDLENFVKLEFDVPEDIG